jgi:cell division septal protein FtsQ
MWYDDPFVKLKKGKTNRKRRKGGRGQILMVNAKVAQQRREHLQRVATVVLCTVAFLGVTAVLVMGGRMILRKLYSENPAYTVRHLDIRSDGNRIPKPLLMEFGGLERGVNLFAVNLEEVRSNLLSVPLVREVLVRRVLPDELLVLVTERVAVARFGPDSLAYPMAIDAEGIVLGRGSRSPNLPLITGPGTSRYRPGQEATESAVRDALQVLDIVGRSNGLSRLIRIERIDVGNPAHLLLYLDNGPMVRLSRENMEKNLGKLAVSIQDAEENGRTWRELDFTVEQNIAAL